MYRIDNWINERYGWIVELIGSQYINVSTHRPLSGSSYIKLPAELRSSKKGLISIKNNNQKCFLWCHVKHANLVKIDPERITRKDKKLVNNLNYDGVGFPVREKDFCKIEKKNSICVVLCFENKLSFQIYPPGMRGGSDVSIRFHIGPYVADHAETSSRRHNSYVNNTDLFETSL